MNYGQQIPSFPYQQFQPFGMANPIGSIVGLRVVQLDSGLGYIPVEPHINYLINQQYGRGGPILANTAFHEPPVGNFPPSSQTITASSTPASIPPADPGPHRSQQRTQSHDPPKRQAQKEIEDDWFKPTPQPKSGVRRSAHWRNEEDYDPWGRGGAGAPMRDSLGRIVADRGKLRAAFRNRAGSLANLSISDTPQAALTRQTMDQPLSSQEIHKLELMKQIEENKRRREIERQQELDLERKEMRKLEEYNIKIRREEEEERKREKNRAAAMERRAAAIAVEQDARARQMRRRPSPPLVENVQPQGRRGSESIQRPPPPVDDEEEQPPRLEWWERKANYDDPRKSAVIPTMRNGQATRPASRNGRHAYSPAESVRQHQSRGQSRDQPRSENTGPRGASSKPRRASQRPPNPDDERPIRPSGTNAPFDDNS